jgi:hypothetical protein
MALALKTFYFFIKRNKKVTFYKTKRSIENNKGE